MILVIIAVSKGDYNIQAKKNQFWHKKVILRFVMKRETIVSLYWARNESAIAETSSKYGGLCNHIANNILSNYQDREECINDTYLAVWNAIPDKHPNRFSVFLSRIVRNLALKETIYKHTGFSQSKVKSMLYKMRRKLKKYLVRGSKYE